MDTLPLENDSEVAFRLHRRFDRMGRLVGDEAMKKLANSHVMIIGLGGVGSWAAESITRSGVGKISVVDFDEICITNTNRQMHALTGLVGQLKSEVMAERLRKINPQAKVDAVSKFYNADSSDEIFALKPDLIIDAIDNITTKCHLLARCVRDAVPVVCSTGSAGKMDPTRIRIADLSVTERDPLARSIRRILRSQYGFSETGSFGIPAVYSDEEVIEPIDLSYDKGQGFKCVCPQGNNGLNTCDQKNIILGNASFVTGAFGLACVSAAIRKIIADGK